MGRLVLKTIILVALLAIVVVTLSDAVFQSDWETKMIRAREAITKQRQKAAEAKLFRATPKSNLTSLVSPHKVQKSRFSASILSCCKTGERAAKKGLTCSANMHAEARSNNFVNKVPLKGKKSRDMKVLNFRIAKCAINYSKNFEKCCTFRAQYKKEMAKCKRLSKRRDKRKKCREQVRKRYPSVK